MTTVVDVIWPSRVSEIFTVLILLAKKQTVDEIRGNEILGDIQFKTHFTVIRPQLFD